MHVSSNPARCVLFVLLALHGVSAAALDLRVGVGTGCDHPTLGAALQAVRNQAGLHNIRINKGTYPVPDGMTYIPTVAQTGVLLEGGYDSCTAAVPSGDPTVDADRAVFDGSGGIQRSVLDLRLNNLVGTFQLRRIVLTGGDATDAVSSETWVQSGGGLAVRGRASVLIGRGASIKGNAAINGGGVVLTGSAVSSAETPARIDFFIADGAEIANNTATTRGGGIYCGGAPPPPVFGSNVSRHASIVFADGTIAFNQAQQGAAFHCLGSVEVGGGFQPRPANGGLAWIIGNSSTGASGGCAAGQATLDAVVPAGADGRRALGAADNETGLLAITANSGFNPGLCLAGSYAQGTDTQPPGLSRFRIQNVLVSNQSGRGNLGISATQALQLDLAPSSDTVACSFFAPTPCVALTDNSVTSIGGVADSGQLISASSGAVLNLYRASIRDNFSSPQLATAVVDGVLRLYSSIVDDNQIVAAPGFLPGSSMFLAQLGATTGVYQSTLVMRTPLTQFFRLEDGGFGNAHGSILASTVTPASPNNGGNAPAANLTREWCGYFQLTSDFGGHSVTNDPTLLNFVVQPPSAFQLAPGTYAPLSAGLTDACSAPVYNRDFYGRPFTVQLEAGAPVRADIGAVEAQPVALPDPIFANGFEGP